MALWTFNLFMFSSFPKKLLLFVLMAVFALVFSSAKKESDKNQHIYSEMERLEEQAAELEQEKQDLSSLIAFFETENYREREAKKQLGLQNPGEKVIVITRSDESAVPVSQVSETKKESNFSKWISFIFNKHKER